MKVQAGDWGLGPGLYFVSPFYIYFLALALALTKSFTAVRLIQVALGTVAVWFMFETARAWFNERAAWATAILAGATGIFTFYEALILQTAIDTFLTAAALLCLTYALKPGEARAGRWMLAAGVIFGIQTMNRPNVAVAIVGLAIVMAAVRHWKGAALLAAGLAIGMSPAAIRNVIVSHQFSPLSSHGGLNFYIGNGEGANGFYRLIPGITPSIKGQSDDARRVAGKALGRTVTDAEASDYFMDISLRWMAAHPGQTTLLMIRKFGWTFHAQHVPLPYSYPFYQYDWPTWLRFMVIGPWLLVPLGIVGLLFGERRATDAGRRTYIIFISFVPAYAAAVALFFMSERYRLPLLVPLAIGAGAAVDRFIGLARQAAWRSLAAPAATAAVLFVAVNTRAMANDGRWEEGLRLAAQLVLEDRYDEANAWVDRLEAKTAHPGNAAATVGAQLLMKNEPARALTLLERAVKIEPNKPAVEYALGQALLGVGRPADAIPHLEYGVANGASLPMTGYHLAIALKDAGRPDDAVAAIPKIKMSDESPVEDWLTVGRLGMELKAPAVAAPFFQKATELAPNNADARLQYGVSLVVLTRFADAAQELSAATRLNASNAAAFSYLAYSELRLGRVPAAKAALSRALALDPNDPMAREVERENR